MTLKNLNQALLDKDMMNFSSDKKLYITLYGNLINESFKKRVEDKEDIDDVFNDLVKSLQEIQPK
jgi:hypothetical protein